MGNVLALHNNQKSIDESYGPSGGSNLILNYNNQRWDLKGNKFGAFINDALIKDPTNTNGFKDPTNTGYDDMLRKRACCLDAIEARAEEVGEDGSGWIKGKESWAGVNVPLRNIGVVGHNDLHGLPFQDAQLTTHVNTLLEKQIEKDILSHNGMTVRRVHYGESGPDDERIVPLDKRNEFCYATMTAESDVPKDGTTLINYGPDNTGQNSINTDECDNIMKHHCSKRTDGCKTIDKTNGYHKIKDIPACYGNLPYHISDTPKEKGNTILPYAKPKVNVFQSYPEECGCLNSKLGAWSGTSSSLTGGSYNDGTRNVFFDPTEDSELQKKLGVIHRDTYCSEAKGSDWGKGKAYVLTGDRVEMSQEICDQSINAIIEGVNIENVEFNQNCNIGPGSGGNDNDEKVNKMFTIMGLAMVVMFLIMIILI